jgi:hypothetical protein
VIVSVGYRIASPSKLHLLLLSSAAAILAALLFVAVILPAEFHRDPTGFGRFTGLDRLAGPRQVAVPLRGSSTPGNVAMYYATAFRTDFIDIPLSSVYSPQGSELEYKVKMKSGGSVVYSWTVPQVANPEEFYFDFHGESLSKPEPLVVEYLQSTGNSSNGMLLAPMEGVHGWYFQNQSDTPVVVRLKLSGFYELIPRGEHGNEAGIEANKPVATARSTTRPSES